MQKALQSHDNKADVKWNNATKRWQVWREGEKSKKQMLVKTIQNKDGSYREPGADTVHDLRKNDMRRFGNVNAIERKFRQTHDEDRSKAKLKRADQMNEITKAHRHKLAGNPVVGSTPAYRHGYDMAFGGK